MLPAYGICYSISHLRRMWENGKFPRPRKLSARRLAGSLDELEAWANSKLSSQK
jgi:predicted DNA-binding transcriptional regulator AlpA